MRHDKLGLQLELLLLLTENRQWTVEQICQKLHIQKRNLYYYLDFFRGADFNIVKHGAYYSISRDSKFISRLCDIVKFSEDEIMLIKRLLDESDNSNMLVRSLKQKLMRFYDFNIIGDEQLRLRHAKIVSTMYEAIRSQQMVVIHNYSSAHSGSVTDRIIEPFLLMNGNRDIRAYEIKSKMNKTFRLSRMESVTLLDEKWLCRSEHRQIYTDIFNFASEDLIPVTLRLDQLSYNVLVEEFPLAEKDITSDGEHWLYNSHVCSLKGIGRFVIGLYDHIEIINSPELEDYVCRKLKLFSEKRSV
ncbi:MAG: WYL domain-containing protein [Prevotella sp.]|jgi:predicted DNA-binding transcriptional regulator YafY|nr:WYL domain-containing protein [Prevotella sp.]